MSVVLKPGFAPPEQYTGRNQGPWTDVYALAGLFYYMVSGSKVPPVPDRVTGTEYMPLDQAAPQCSRETAEVVDQALAVNYKERIQSTGRFIELLEKACGSSSLQEEPARGGKIEQLEKPSDAGQSRGQSSSVRQLKQQRHKPKALSPEQFPYLAIITNEVRVETWRLPFDSEIMVGRDAKFSNIVIRGNNQISKQHLAVCYQREEGQFSIVDLSTNGVYFNGARLKKGKEQLVPAGSRLMLGSKLCILEIGVQ